MELVLTEIQVGVDYGQKMYHDNFWHLWWTQSQQVRLQLATLSSDALGRCSECRDFTVAVCDVKVYSQLWVAGYTRGHYTGGIFLTVYRP